MNNFSFSNKSGVKNAVNMGLLLEFEVAFPGEQPLTPAEYLKGGSKEFILNAAAFLLGFKVSNSEFTDNKKFIQMFFRQENQQFAQDVYNNIKTLERTGAKVRIINPYTSLRLFEYFFSKPDEPETQTQAEFERNLFKAYLVLNSEFTKKQGHAFESTDGLDESLRLSMIMFCMHYPVADKVNFDIYQIWATQIVKAIYLFQYLEADKKMQPLLSAFLSHFNKPTWQDYLKALLPLTGAAIKNENESHTDIIIPVGEGFEEGCEFVEKLVINESDELEENDFLTTRAAPFYKVSEGVYRIIFSLFVVEKIFKGVYFLLRDVNNTLPAQQKISGLKGVYCYEFSEKTLVYRVMDVIYSDKFLKFTGQQLSDMRIDGAPDYYIRKNNNIIIFESKDFLIRADLKASFDYNVYDEEFAKTLYYQEISKDKEKAGAVMQLIGTIKKLLKNCFPADKDYYYKDIYIYPVVITHDHQYDVPGLSDLINNWFQDELAILKKQGHFVYRVKPIVIINIDSLIYYQVALSKNVTLHKVLDAYYEHIALQKRVKFKTLEDVKAYRMDKMIPFSLFIEKYFNNLGIKKLPPIMDLVAPSLFAEEYTTSKEAEVTPNTDASAT